MSIEGNIKHYGNLYPVGSCYHANYEEIPAEAKAKIRAYIREQIEKNDLKTCTHFQIPWGVVLEEGGYIFGKKVMVSNQKAIIEMLEVIMAEQGLRRRFTLFNNTDVENSPWVIAFVF